MSILLVGLNHRKAPVEIREQFAFSRDGVATALMSGGRRRPALAFPRAALREPFEETGLRIGTPGRPKAGSDSPT